ncbi:MAG: LysM peptidoglycan-binding domain-containing protein [Actinobacteria bacterium]|uniref:Unannotated protein n=1 Tax=freshwater metagenome TaxID=449393 RepID=A0A6J7VZA0_9ZZZZ|nr:LysM peptidoglycan-binding domain-containing protein [Actinomycetota bacterium]
MSAMTFNSVASESSVNQGFFANPSGVESMTRLSRRGRLARTVVVLSLSVVMAAGFAARSGAGDQVVHATSYTTVVVPGGATLWEVASAYTNGDVQAMVEAIREANNLEGYDVAAGARLRIPTA